MRTSFALTLCGALLPLSGCCSLARLFCGPDKSPWISVRYDRPELAVATLLEAIRRDEPEIVYLSLAEEYQRSLGLDLSTTKLAWVKIREQNPGLHLAGYAEIPPPVRRADNGATFRLDVEGTQLEIDVARQSLRQIRWSVPTSEGPVGGEEGAIVSSWNSYARVEVVDDPEENRSMLSVQPMPFHHDSVARVPLDCIDEFTLTRVWKVTRIAIVKPE